MDKSLLYTLEVFLVSGPITEDFAKRNPVVSRSIEIRGNQTLAELHDMIFQAFDREEEHLYEFQVKGQGPSDPQAERYVSPSALNDANGVEGSSSETPIGSLDLAVGEAFGYWFDFGDDWWHQINVMTIKDSLSQARYPAIIGRVGESPPQYANFDEA